MRTLEALSVMGMQRRQTTIYQHTSIAGQVTPKYVDEAPDFPRMGEKMRWGAAREKDSKRREREAKI